MHFPNKGTEAQRVNNPPKITLPVNEDVRLYSGYSETHPSPIEAKLCVVYFSFLFSRFLAFANILLALINQRDCWGRQLPEAIQISEVLTQ